MADGGRLLCLPARLTGASSSPLFLALLFKLGIIAEADKDGPTDRGFGVGCKD